MNQKMIIILKVLLLRKKYQVVKILKKKAKKILKLQKKEAQT